MNPRLLVITGPEQGASYPIDMDSLDRKSTRLNSSHLGIPYAVFCLKKKRIRVDAGCARHSRRRRRPAQQSCRAAASSKDYYVKSALPRAENKAAAVFF